MVSFVEQKVLVKWTHASCVCSISLSLCLCLFHVICKKKSHTVSSYAKFQNEWNVRSALLCAAALFHSVTPSPSFHRLNRGWAFKSCRNQYERYSIWFASQNIYTSILLLNRKKWKWNQVEIRLIRMQFILIVQPIQPHAFTTTNQQLLWFFEPLDQHQHNPFICSFVRWLLSLKRKVHVGQKRERPKHCGWQWQQTVTECPIAGWNFHLVAGIIHDIRARTHTHSLTLAKSRTFTGYNNKTMFSKRKKNVREKNADYDWFRREIRSKHDTRERKTKKCQTVFDRREN